MYYHFSIPNPTSKYILIEFTVENINAAITNFNLPAWRPGRYELGNFAKNIQQWNVFDENNNALPFKKIGKDCWQVQTKNIKQVTVKYNYYAAQFDAGACWLEEKQLYANPIHCCLFLKERMNEPCLVELNIPDDWKVATSLAKQSQHIFLAEDYHELVDSPIIASPTLQHNSYSVAGKTFHIHIQGEYKPDWEKLLKDFTGFTKVQLQMMKELPTTFNGNSFTDYHFLIQVLPYQMYHGVEHLKSTVLAIGDGKDLNTHSLYKELIGVASHELFHVWNIKSIRPAQMLPYDYTRENYATTGYIYEGITTYYGDLFLSRSRFFSLEEYLLEVAERFQKHIRNAGRFNYSVAQSSFDTWLDGYNPGVPGRKSSIYDEGSLIALLLDFLIRKATQNKKSLDNVMQRMFTEFAKNKVGYQEEDFKRLCEEESNRTFDDFFKNFVNAAVSYESLMMEVLDFAGLQIVDTTQEVCNESFYGFATAKNKNVLIITNVAPASPGALSGLQKGDELISVNGQKVNGNLQELLSKNNSEIHLDVFNNGSQKQLTITRSNKSFFPALKIEAKEKLTKEQAEFLFAWCGGSVVKEKVTG